MGGRGGIVEKRGMGWTGVEEVRLGRTLDAGRAQISIGEEKGPDHHGISFPFPNSHYFPHSLARVDPDLG